ncbi:MAG: hypothetical protein JRI80_00365 [Deltaproteobacteria bacterium]|nr:hypothetical protein [Deltaproteobacteria bacterium]
MHILDKLAATKWLLEQCEKTCFIVYPKDVRAFQTRANDSIEIGETPLTEMVNIAYINGSCSKAADALGAALKKEILDTLQKKLCDLASKAKSKIGKAKQIIDEYGDILNTEETK